MQVELCRLCLGKNNLVPLFCGVQKIKNYSKVLMLTTGLQIEENDGFPQMICHSCTKLVKSAFDLRNTSQNSESKLKKLGYIKHNKQRGQDFKSEEFYKLEIDTTTKTENLEAKNYDETTKYGILVGLNKLNNIIDDQIQDDSQTIVNHDDVDEIQETSLKTSLITANSNIAESEDILLKNKNVKVLSRKEKRAMYMSLVEGKFDPKGPIKCKVCKKTVSKWASFMTHSKLHLGFKFVCEYCGKSFISSTQLNRHCRSHHGMSRELACRHCDYLALDNTQLVLHERRVHTGERPFICDLCGTSYFSRRCLIQHIENHSTIKTIQCEKCPQMFKSRRHLARHTYTTHTSKQYSYKCPVCAHIYRNLKYIRVHLKKLHGLTTKDAKIVKIKL